MPAIDAPRTRTAPAQDAEVARLRLALASCQHYEQITWPYGTIYSPITGSYY